MPAVQVSTGEETVAASDGNGNVSLVKATLIVNILNSGVRRALVEMGDAKAYIGQITELFGQAINAATTGGSMSASLGEVHAAIWAELEKSVADLNKLGAYGVEISRLIIGQRSDAPATQSLIGMREFLSRFDQALELLGAILSGSRRNYPEVEPHQHNGHAVSSSQRHIA